MLLYFIRHGETERNKDKRILGHSDIPLSGIGMRQADLLGEQLQQFNFDAIYSSPLLRAYQTAEAIVRHQNNKHHIVSDARLQERGFGVYEGTSIQNFDRIFSGNIVPEDKVEDNEYRLQKFQESLQEIINNHHTEASIIIVSHGGQIGSWIERTFGIDFPHLGNTSISIIGYYEGNTKLIQLNNTEHLLSLSNQYNH